MYTRGGQAFRRQRRLFCESVPAGDYKSVFFMDFLGTYKMMTYLKDTYELVSFYEFNVHDIVMS